MAKQPSEGQRRKALDRSAAFYESIIRDRKTSATEKIKAQTRIDEIFGLAAFVQGTDTEKLRAEAFRFLHLVVTDSKAKDADRIAAWSALARLKGLNYADRNPALKARSTPCTPEEEAMISREFLSK